MTEGATAAKAFVGWAMELERVYREQPRVLKFLRWVSMNVSQVGEHERRQRQEISLQHIFVSRVMGLIRKPSVTL